MSSPTTQLDGESLLVHQCRQGDMEALARLRDKSHASLVNILLARGASPTEAEDFAADLWADGVPGDSDRPSLLEKFSGKCTLQGWLATVATNRWIDFKRRHARRVELSQGRPGEDEVKAMENLPGLVSRVREDALVALLRASLQASFALCSPDAMVLLRLVYMHGLTQREIVRMLGWSESKVSRALARAMEEIEANTLNELKMRDPWLELSWQDFVDLCETHQIGFL